MPTDRDAQRSSASGADTAPPKKGDRFHCQSCGMEIQVTADCGCKSGENVQFECCGQSLTKS